MDRPITVDIVGHSFVKRLRRHCRRSHIDNLDLDERKHIVSFVHEAWDEEEEKLNGMFTISHLAEYASTYSSPADLVYVEMGCNDVYTNRNNPGPCAHQLVSTAETFFNRGARVVLLAQVLPRTAYGMFGCAAHRVNPSPQEMMDLQHENEADTGEFNRIV